MNAHQRRKDLRNMLRRSKIKKHWIIEILEALERIFSPSPPKLYLYNQKHITTILGKTS